MQNDLFNAPVEPDVLWLPDFLSREESDQAFHYCQSHLPWESKSVFWDGREIKIPRLLAWFGDVPYAYSGLAHPARPMPAELTALKQKIEETLAQQGLNVVFNSVLLNYYRDGQDSIGMHADDETQLGPEPVIASLSLGATRTFKMAYVGHTAGMAKRAKREYALTSGALLVMKGLTQQEWRHGIPKEPGAGPRINLTFRLTHAG